MRQALKQISLSIEFNFTRFAMSNAGKLESQKPNQISKNQSCLIVPSLKEFAET